MTERLIAFTLKIVQINFENVHKTEHVALFGGLL